MERREFLKFSFGLVAGAAALGAAAQAAPIPPISPESARVGAKVEPAVVSQEDVDRIKPEQVRWHRHGHWHRRHWGWRRRHWGWRHRRWHRRWHRHRHW